MLWFVLFVELKCFEYINNVFYNVHYIMIMVGSLCYLITYFIVQLYTQISSNTHKNGESNGKSNRKSHSSAVLLPTNLSKIHDFIKFIVNIIYKHTINNIVPEIYN